MGTAERRARERKDLRERILQAARGIITQEGFKALSMRKLAERIEYSPAALYLHFKNRAEIARELSLEGYRELLAYMSAVPPMKDAGARMKALGHAYVRFGLERPETYRLIFMEDPEYLAAVFASKPKEDPDMQAFELLVRTAAELLAGKRSPRTVPMNKAVVFAETFWAAIHGIVSLKLTCPMYPSAPAEVLTETMTNALVRGMAAPRKAQ